MMQIKEVRVKRKYKSLWNYALKKEITEKTADKSLKFITKS